VSSTGSTSVPEFDVRLVTGGGSPVVVVRGAVDLAVVGPLWDAVEPTLEVGRPLVLDLTGVSFIDSSGLSLIVRAYQWHGRDREAVVLRVSGPEVRRAIALAGLDELITIEDVGAAPPSGA
jgi:anti-sigma B factor antagonist